MTGSGLERIGKSHVFREISDRLCQRQRRNQGKKLAYTTAALIAKSIRSVRRELSMLALASKSVP